MKRLLPYVFLACFSLAACSDKADEDQKAESVEVLYNRAQDQMAEKNYKDAAQSFDEVERQHPYSEWAVKAQLMSAYAYYKYADFDTAAATLERFTKMHPGNNNAAYAYYLRALCFYDRISDVGRDQKMTEEALQSLNEVVQRFPDSDYARDAKIKLDLTIDHLAGKEMEVGRYYQKREEYLSAVNRYRYVVEKYQTTTHIAEALHRLVECYLALGIHEEAERYAAVLGHNYPESRWYKDAYALLKGAPKAEVDKGFLGRILE